MPQSAEIEDPRASLIEARSIPPSIASASYAGLAAGVFEQLWEESQSSSIGFSEQEFAETLNRIGEKLHYGLPPEEQPTPRKIETFFRGLRLQELALAAACALGHEAAWQKFIEQFREPMTRAAIGITGSSSLGQDLADSLYSELYGLTERDGERRSPLASYSGRGSLMGWLRTTLAQRHVDHHRRVRRETPLEDQDFPAQETAPVAQTEVLLSLQRALRTVLSSLDPEERFMLSSWFLDRHTLLQIAKLLRVHEATVSRKLKRLTELLRKDLIKQLQAGGMSRRAAEEALGADPRDIDINLRNLLQNSPPPPFSKQGPHANREQI